MIWLLALWAALAPVDAPVAERVRAPVVVAGRDASARAVCDRIVDELTSAGFVAQVAPPAADLPQLAARFTGAALVLVDVGATPARASLLLPGTAPAPLQVSDGAGSRAGELLALAVVERLQASLLPGPVPRATERPPTVMQAAVVAAPTAPAALSYRLSVSALGGVGIAQMWGAELAAGWGRGRTMGELALELARSSTLTTTAGDLVATAASARAGVFVRVAELRPITAQLGVAVGLVRLQAEGAPAPGYAEVPSAAWGVSAAVSARAGVPLSSRLRLVPAIDLGATWPRLVLGAAGGDAADTWPLLLSARLGVEWR